MTIDKPSKHQLDGASCHWFCRLGLWNWPARSPVLIQLDFYFMGTLKKKIIRHLKTAKKMSLSNSGF